MRKQHLVAKVRRRPAFFFLVLFAGLWGLGEAPSFGQTITPNWAVSEFQPNIQEGGRANTIARHPSNDDNILVASETGGLFRSRDRGVTWRHVDGLPSFKTNSVTFVRSNPTILLATTEEYYKTAAGGIWRSTDDGATWTQSTVPLPAGLTGPLLAWEISTAPDSDAIYVATEFGLAKSQDNGASWTFQDVFGNGNRRVLSVLALGGSRVLAGGPQGIRRSPDGGQTWFQPTTTAGTIGDMHAFGRSPHSYPHAYVVNNATDLFRTEDGGDNWTQITSAPAGGGACGGIGFVKAVPRIVFNPFIPVPGLELYFGNRCGVARLPVPFNLSTGQPTYNRAWQALNIDHDDTRDLAFDTSTWPIPLLLGTDGGLHATNDLGANWHFVGGGRGGFNALQITEVKGQYVADAGRHDLYFGTQDNNMWSSDTTGQSWTNGMCCEGFFIEAQRWVATASDSNVTNVACFECNNKLSDILFSNVRAWPNPPGNVAGNPMIVVRSRHLQGVDESGGLAKGLALTTDLGATWQQFVTFPEERRDIPKLGSPGSLFSSLKDYQAYRAGMTAAGGEINHLIRVQKRIFRAPTVSYAAMNNFGGLGISPTMFAWYQVFGINPVRPLHLMAPDVVNGRVKESQDGGENWTEVPNLANLATDGGRLLFTSRGLFPVITAISFSPQDPRLVLAGTVEGGIYQSTDTGVSWTRIANSRLVPWVTGFYWRNVNDVIISTYGRGLWRLKNRPVVPREDVERECHAPCDIRNPRQYEPIAPPRERLAAAQAPAAPAPPAFARAILVYDGEVRGARGEGDVLREVFVTPGSSVLFAAEAQQLTPEIGVTLTNDVVGFGGLPLPPEPPQKGWIIKGLVFGKDNRLTGYIFGDQPMAMAPPESTEEVEGSPRSPVADRPYVQIAAKRNDGVATASPGEPIGITGTNFPTATILQMMLDGQPAGDRIAVDGQGAFSTEVLAPLGFGLHSVWFTIEGKKTVLDGSMFLVKHLDDFEKDE